MLHPAAEASPNKLEPTGTFNSSQYRMCEVLFTLPVLPRHIKGLVINNGEGGGGLQNEKIAGAKLFAPPLQDRVKLFTPPLLKSGNF